MVALESAVAITLPYEFDTTRVTKLILKGLIWFELVVVVPGILYSVVGTGNRPGALLLFVIGCMAAFFGSLVAKHLEGSVGTITANDVVVSRGKVLGLRIPGPSGRFSLHPFGSVRVYMSSGPVSTDETGGPHERIYLVGRDGAPDILIARTNRNDADYGMSAGMQFGRLLNLPCEAKRVLY